MSKIISIILTGFILIQGLQIGAEDFLQLDELIEHAQFHQEKYGDDFFVFLSKHYGELKSEHSNSHEEEKNDHEQLPFQCQGHYVLIIAFISPLTNQDTLALNFLEQNHSNFQYSNLYASLFGRELLQPPRKA